MKDFIHPDGGIGGIYGARNTEFYFPDGFENFSDQDINAKAISIFMRKSISHRKCVNLSSIDIPNIIPMFNSYCRAAIQFIKNKKKTTAHLLPCQKNELVFKFYEEAGLIIHNDNKYFCIVSTKKGGACLIFDKKLNQSKYNYGALCMN